MTISNGYSDLASFKAFKNIDSTDTTDDTVIEDIIEAVSRYIDRKTGRTFYAKSETRYFDVPEGRELDLRADLLTVTTLTNGDGTVIAAAYYNLEPRNSAPYYAIKIKQSSPYLWQLDTNGNMEGVISVAGTWGFSATTPDDIKELCLEIASNIYQRRSGQGADAAATITGAGVVLSPRDVPGWARDVLEFYKRRL